MRYATLVLLAILAAVLLMTPRPNLVTVIAPFEPKPRIIDTGSIAFCLGCTIADRSQVGVSLPKLGAWTFSGLMVDTERRYVGCLKEKP